MQRGSSQVKQLYKHDDFNNKISGILAAAIKPYEAQRGPELLPGMRSWYVSEMRRPLLRPGTRSSVTREACAGFPIKGRNNSQKEQPVTGNTSAFRGGGARSPVTGMFTKCFNGIIFCCASLRSQAEQFV